MLQFNLENASSNLDNNILLTFFVYFVQNSIQKLFNNINRAMEKKTQDVISVKDKVIVISEFILRNSHSNHARQWFKLWIEAEFDLQAATSNTELPINVIR